MEEVDINLNCSRNYKLLRFCMKKVCLRAHSNGFYIHIFFYFNLEKIHTAKINLCPKRHLVIVFMIVAEKKSFVKMNQIIDEYRSNLHFGIGIVHSSQSTLRYVFLRFIKTCFYLDFLIDLFQSRSKS